LIGKRSRALVCTRIPGSRNGLSRSFNDVSARIRPARVGVLPARLSAATNECADAIA
jgi:hypothetical protein